MPFEQEISKSNQYYKLIQTNFLTFRSCAIVHIGIQTHKEKKIIVEKYFFSRFRHFKAQ